MPYEFTDHEKTDIGRLILLKSIQRRLALGDIEAANDVKDALDKVDTADWVSCLRWACVLTDQCERMVVA
jgi:hypothetical protein